MAVEFSITNRAEALKQIKQAVISSTLPELINRNKEYLEDRASDLFIERLVNHKVVRGIAGDYPDDETRDLQAIFGLDIEQSVAAIDGMINLVKRLMKVTVSNTRSSVKINLSMSDIEESFIAEYGTYSYYSTRYKTVLIIPWAEWLFEGGSTEAGISFDVETFKNTFSRSGRAIMTSQEESWDFNPLDYSRNSSMFLDVANSRVFINSIKEEIIQLLKTRLNPLGF